MVATNTSGHVFRRGLHLVQQTGHAGNTAWAFMRPTVTFDMTVGMEVMSDEVYSHAMFTGGDADRFSYLGTTYEWPEAAADNPLHDQWLYFYQPDENPPRSPGDDYYISLEVQSCYDGSCLPAGTYRAVMHYRYSPVGGAIQNIDHIVTMNLHP